MTRVLKRPAPRLPRVVKRPAQHPPVERPLVHLLREVDGNKGMVRSRCGAEARKRPSDPMPATFSGWASQVTCSICLGES